MATTEVDEHCARLSEAIVASGLQIGADNAVYPAGGERSDDALLLHRRDGATELLTALYLSVPW